MRRTAAVLVMGGVIVGHSAANLLAAADEPPPLTPPTLLGPAADAPAELPPVFEPAPLPEIKPLYVVPGMPRPRTSPRVDRSPASRGSSSIEVLPPLIGPAEMGRAGRPSASSSSRGRTSLPLTIESTPASEDELSASKRAMVSPSRKPFDSLRSWTAPRRQPGLLGRFLPPVMSERPRDESSADLRDSVTVEPRTDPAADAALKRRIEKQAREAVGGKVGSIDVRVVGREVTIFAHGARFWQKRAVRSTLEALPGLSGYKAVVELVD